MGAALRSTRFGWHPATVSLAPLPPRGHSFAHMRVLDGLDTSLQMSGLVGKLCFAAHASRGGRPLPPQQAQKA